MQWLRMNDFGLFEGDSISNRPDGPAFPALRLSPITYVGNGKQPSISRGGST